MRSIKTAGSSRRDDFFIQTIWSMKRRPFTPTQASRIGRTPITFFVRDGAKPMIRAALADAGYGTSFQAGMVNILNDLLRSQRRQPIV
jgi:hypothetical protein